MQEVRQRFRAVLAWTAVPCLAAAAAAQSFVHFETPHVHPLELTPDGSRLVAVNTPDARIEVFQPTGRGVVHLFDVQVGLDPVSVRARSDREVWVVNHVSDSISIVDLRRRAVVATIATADEPADVVFAGAPERAFVSCSQANLIQVFDPADLSKAPAEVPILGEDPRALAVSLDGSRVYAAIFESGNSTTILGGGLVVNVGSLPNVVNDPTGPYGGQNPPPNAGAGFDPPINPALPPPPRVGLIVRKDAAGRWMDDNGGDWTELVSGANAAKSGRPVGWDVADNDVAILDADTLAVTYQRHLMNICMALAVNPANGEVTLVGTDATNEIRFEPVINGTFLRVQLARVDPGNGALGVVDLNPHLDYQTPTIPQRERDKSLGDPRGIAWNTAGTRAYVTGMGSNNVVVLDATGARAGKAPAIEVGEGPTGVALDEARELLYVLDKFESALSVVDLKTETETLRVPFHDPSPEAIRTGRKHLYDTHAKSGLGHVACASCHVDARMDRLAWDLGDPSGAMKSVIGQNLGANIPGLNTGFQNWHPMKGPMTTQTLQDIIGKEPMHWRGDRDGLEEFNAAFRVLQGDDEELSAQELQEFEDFLATIHFPPNPFRNLDNTLKEDLPLPGQFATGTKQLAKGAPLPNGNARRGLELYRFPNRLDAGAFSCTTCHTLPVGIGTDSFWNGSSYAPFPVGPNGERHHQLISQDGSTNVSIKTPQLRNLYEKVGFETSQPLNLAGFGFLHDGSVDSLASFVASPVFTVTSDQQVADLVALLLSFSGSDLMLSPPAFFFEPPGPTSQDAHAAVGVQTTLASGSNPDPQQAVLLAEMIALAQSEAVGLVVKGRWQGLPRGYFYRGNDLFQADRLAERWSTDQLMARAGPGSELTFTVVPFGSQVRLGVDRDRDGTFDRDELDQGTDPADPASL